MVTVKCTYSNGVKLVTKINGTIEGAEHYFLGQWFNLGIIEDNIQQCIEVELI